MDCPNCGLVNPDTAQRCDCGYDFYAKTVKESYLNLSSTSPLRVTKEGGILTVPRGAVLPPYCVKCGIPTQAKPVKKTFTWHPPWIMVFLFPGASSCHNCACHHTKEDRPCRSALSRSPKTEEETTDYRSVTFGTFRPLRNLIWPCSWGPRRCGLDHRH
jgi:hypothetical protein